MQQNVLAMKAANDKINEFPFIYIQCHPSVVETLGTWQSALYAVEPLYCGHLGDLVKCPVCSGTPFLRTPWRPSEVSCMQWNPSMVDTLGTW